jgi:uncharacterized protein YutE (UPF0331/DUF86 family)
MENRKTDKIIEIEEYLGSLEEFLPSCLKDYLSDKKTKAACERYFEIIIESVIDLVFLIIKESNFRSPDSDRDALLILAENKIITEELSEQLGNAKSMRNIVIHEYGNIDDELVFETLKNKFTIDIKKFLENIK